jgi:hypothetical protein
VVERIDDLRFSLIRYIKEGDAYTDMEIQIFTGGSNTTTNRSDVEHVEDFFKGSFLAVSGLADDLREYGDVSINIISDEYGYLRGTDSIDKLNHNASMSAKTKFSEQLHQASTSTDVLIVLLSKSEFESTVGGHWNDITEDIKSGGIWCLGLPNSVISSLDLSEVRAELDNLLIYPRVGVARIDSETKSELIELVSEIYD